MNDETLPTPENVIPISTEQSPLIRQGWLRALLFLIAMVPAVFIWGIANVLIIRAVGADYQSDTETLLQPIGIAIQALYLGTTLLVIWAFRRFIDRRSFVSLGFSFETPVVRHLVYGLFWGVGLMVVVFGLTFALGGFSITSTQFPANKLAILFFTLLPAAALEEVIMRGYLLHSLMQSTNRYIALLFTSMLFALGHGFNDNVTFLALANIVLAGLLLGIYYIHRQNLWFPIALHFAWNYMQSPILGSPVSGAVTPSILTLDFTGSNLITGGKFGFEGSLVTTVVTIVAILVVHFTYRTKKEQSATS